jgi:hypothetical protein
MVGVEFDLRSALWKYFGQQNKGLPALAHFQTRQQG